METDTQSKKILIRKVMGLNPHAGTNYHHEISVRCTIILLQRKFYRVLTIDHDQTTTLAVPCFSELVTIKKFLLHRPGLLATWGSTGYRLFSLPQAAQVKLLGHCTLASVSKKLESAPYCVKRNCFDKNSRNSRKIWEQLDPAPIL